MAHSVKFIALLFFVALIGTEAIVDATEPKHNFEKVLIRMARGNRIR
jgi:hypothetical protein